MNSLLVCLCIYLYNVKKRGSLMKSIPVALTIAGSDSSGGAGIQSDIKTFHELGVFPCSVITCLTAQNSTEVREILSVNENFVEKQISAVTDDMNVVSVKIGMLYNTAIIGVVAHCINRYSLRNIVIDPVMVSTSNDSLIAHDLVMAYREKLLPLADLVTPNLYEASMLSGRAVINIEDMREAALEITGYGAKNVLIKGGHLEEEKATDLLYNEGVFEKLTAKVVESEKEFHGTGCMYSAAITAYIAYGNDILTSVKKAKDFVTLSIKKAYSPGKGSMFLNHRH